MAIDPILAALAFEETVPNTAATGPDLTRYALVCTGILTLVLSLAWLFRRFVADNVRRRAAKRALQVTDVLPLGGRRRLVVVRCYDRNFLVGLGEKEITNIAELDAELVEATEEAPAAPVVAAAQAPPTPAPVRTAPEPTRIEDTVQPIAAPVKQTAEPQPFSSSLAEELRKPRESGRRRDRRDRRVVERWKSGEGLLG